MEWTLAEARDRLGDLVNLALTEGPQRVRDSQNEVVVIASEAYERLAGPRGGFKEYLMTGETFDGLDLERDQSACREVEF